MSESIEDVAPVSHRRIAYAIVALCAVLVVALIVTLTI
jgi:hypothetical protein